MTVALYCRVSTDEQAEQGYSIENQKDRLVQFALSQGWDDYRFYIDDGYTGTNLNRPQLQRLIQHVKTGKVDKVLVHKVDRLSRRQKDVLYLLEDIFIENNVVFRSATEPFDTSPFGKAMIGILAVFAQLERDTIIERTTMGRRQRFKKGMWYGGRVPFGYDWDKDSQQLVVNPAQAQLVREIYKKYLEGYSYNAIAEWVSMRTQDRVFDHGRVRELLMRPIYTGKIQNLDQLVDGQHEAIIDAETWQRAQEENARRRDGKKPTGEYLLTGLMECGVCGGPMIHISMKQTRGKAKKGSVYHYYVCKRQHVKPKGWTHTCRLGYKRDDELEELLIKQLKKASLNTKVVKSEIASMYEPSDETEQVILELQNELSDVTKRLDRWYDAFETGTLNPSQLSDRIRGLEEQKRMLELRIDELSPTIPPIERTDDVLESLSLIAKAWDVLNFEERRAVLRTAIQKVVIHPGETPPRVVWNV